MNFPVINPILVKSEDVVNWNTRMCLGCLAVDSVLYDLREKGLELVFGELTGLPVSPSRGYVCCLCLQLIRKFQAFRLRCRNAHITLQQLQVVRRDLRQEHNKQGNKNVSSIYRKHLKYNLEIKNTVLIDIASHTRKQNLETTTTAHVDIVPDQDVNNLYTTTKCEIDSDSPLLIGEFITADYDTTVDVKVFGEHIKEDFIWSDPDNDINHDNEPLPLSKSDDESYDNKDFNNDNDDDDEQVLKKISLSKKNNKKRKAESSKKLQTKKEESRDSRKVKKIKLEKTKNDKTEKIKLEKATTSEELDTITPNKKVQSEELMLSTKIASTLRGIWKKNKNKDIYQLFETIYMESLAMKTNENSSKTGSSKSIYDSPLDEDVSARKKIRNFLDLVRKISDIYNVDTDFIRLEELRKEMEEKRNSGKYKVDEHGCELCCKQYNFLDTYQRHMLRNHNNSWQIECEICRYRFKTQRDFLTHIMGHARTIKCRECGANIPGKWCSAKKHVETHRGVVHTCTLCNQTFTRKKSLSMHLRARHREEIETVMCLLCGDTYNGDEGLTIHIRCMHKQAVHCKSCSVWFHSEDALTAHARPEAGGCQPLHSSCPMCGANFANTELMLEHHKEQHPMYKCEKCKIAFGDKKICIHFKYNHNLVKGKSKSQKKRVRSGYNKDIICEVCGKNNFTCVATLKIHQRIHTGERPFQCDICQKTFRMRSDLKLHSTIHTGERSYKCPYCPRTFRQQPHLKSHLPSHTKEKAHVCEICHKRFTQRANMQEHVRTIHEGLPPKRRQRHSKIFEA